jgi:hypothetical protein
MHDVRPQAALMRQFNIRQKQIQGRIDKPSIVASIEKIRSILPTLACSLLAVSTDASVGALTPEQKRTYAKSVDHASKRLSNKWALSPRWQRTSTNKANGHEERAPPFANFTRKFRIGVPHIECL